MSIIIYRLSCPVTGQTRYVGKSKGSLKLRLKAHISKARSGATKHHCAHWIRTLLAVGEKPGISVILELPDGADWQSVEIATIKEYRASGHDLTNLTSGGDGVHDLPLEVLQRRGKALSAALREPETNARFRAAMKRAYDECAG